MARGPSPDTSPAAIVTSPVLPATDCTGAAAAAAVVKLEIVDAVCVPVWFARCTAAAWAALALLVASEAAAEATAESAAA